MYSRIFIVALALINIINANAQFKYDNTWVMGNSVINPNNIMEFGDTLHTDYKKTAFPFDVGGTSISDKYGNLALYFNGCQLADGNHKLIDDGFNPGYVYDNYCPPKGFGYTAGQQSNLILPIPERNDEYIIFHSNLRFYFEVDSFNFYSSSLYSIIDARGTKPKVIKKNLLVVQDTTIGGVYTAVKNKNGIDWWVIIQDRYYTNGYYKILVTKDTIIKVSYQNIGNNIKLGGAGGSSACFSPDGSHYASFNSDDGLILMDFDRESGLFSNFKHLSVEKVGIGNGCSFSPNGRFIYLCDYSKLYQVDIESDSLVAELVAEWDGFREPGLGLPVVFGPMQTGPDCRIYVSTGRSPEYWGVILEPDKKGKDCRMCQHCIEFKANLENIPHFPNFRLDTPYPYCDPNKVLVTGTDDPLLLEQITRQLIISPNPGYDALHIELPYQAQLPLSIDIIDIHGRKIHTVQHDEFEAVTIDVLDWTSGMYVIQLRDRDGRRWAGKWVRM